MTISREDLLDKIQGLSRRVSELEALNKELSDRAAVPLANEERLCRLYEDAPLGYQSLDEDGRILRVNRAWLDSLRRSRDEVVGRMVGDFLTPASRREFEKRFELFKSSGEIPKVEFEMMRKDGSTFSGAFDGQICRDQDGRFLHAHCIMRDTSELEKSREACIEREAGYWDIFETAGLLVYIFDRVGTCLLINLTAARLLGGEPSDFVGKSLSQFSPGNAALFLGRIREVIDAGESRVFEDHVDFAQNPKWLLSEVRPYRMPDSDVQVAQVVSMDISARKEAEEKIAIQNAHMELSQQMARIGYWTFDVATGLPSWSDMMFTVLGWPPEKGAPHYEDHRSFIHPDDWDKFDRAVSGAISGTPYHLELRAVFPDGSIHYVVAEGHPQRNESGAIVSLFGTTQDITERKRAEMALKDSEERFRLITETIDDVFWIGKPGITEIMYVSPAYEKIWGRSREELYRSPRAFIEAVHPEDRDSLIASVGEDHAQGIWGHEYRIIDGDGDIRWIQDRGFPIRDEKGDIRLMTGVARDITERKRAALEKEMLEKRLREAQKLEAVGTLAGGIAHDFNNLLHIISGHAELLGDELASRDMTFQEIDAITFAAHRGAELVNQLLTFSRKAAAEFTVVDINDRALSVAKLLSSTIPKMLEIELNLAEDLGRVLADSTQIEQILINLILNAIDAAHEGSEIYVETERVLLDEEYCRSHSELTPGDHVLLKVRDTGVGMAPDVLEHIFEPFFTTKERAERTGLGLSTVFGVVKSHGGSIECESELGKGTVFSIYLPVIEEAESQAEEKRDVAMPPGGTETVLVVDDDLFIAQLAKRILEKSGYSVITADSGKEALDIFKENPQIDLVVLDLIMPEMGGEECLRELLKIDPGVKAIIASGLAIDKEIEAFLNQAAKGTVSKPFNMAEFLDATRKAIDGV